MAGAGPPHRLAPAEQVGAEARPHPRACWLAQQPDRKSSGASASLSGAGHVAGGARKGLEDLPGVKNRRLLIGARSRSAVEFDQAALGIEDGRGLDVGERRVRRQFGGLDLMSRASS
jgi:hypothetical protein